jgi:predicted glycoside hydrolase/deacetylase ChbG (UPF0249 family)
MATHTGTIKYLIVNADDLGTSEGVNRGTLKAHEEGIVTSASLMVRRPATRAAAQMVRACPRLSVGLHFDLTGEGDVVFDLDDADAVERELRRQYADAGDLLGQPPTHLDSHASIHQRPTIAPIFRRFCEEQDCPARFSGEVRYIGSFYGHAPPDYTQSDLQLVGVDHLLEILATELQPGVNELACHPGYVTADFQSVYAKEREAELETLIDPRVQSALTAHGIRLINYRHLRPRSSSGVH